MARKVDRELLGDGRQQTGEPPCIASGDDRHGPEAPTWVRPNTASSGKGWRAAFDEQLQRDYPTLFDFLTLTGYAGAARRSGTIQVFCEDGKWKGRVQDRDAGYVAFLSADSFVGLLGGLESGLKGGLDWREDKYAKKK